jgi:hypothetical protein
MLRAAHRFSTFFVSEYRNLPMSEMTTRGGARNSDDSNAVTLRLSRDLLSALDNIRSSEPDVPGRPEMMRRILLRYMQGQERTLHEMLAAYFAADDMRITDFGVEQGTSPHNAATELLETAGIDNIRNPIASLLKAFEIESEADMSFDETRVEIIAFLRRISK